METVKTRQTNPLAAARLLLLAAFGLLLGGCLEVETLIKVNQDGSGTVEERFLLGAQLSQIVASSGDQGQSSPVDKEDLRQRATKMGKGVGLKSAEPISDGERQGYLAIFEFQDINQLRINQNPGDKASSPGMQQQETVEEFVTFQFTPGDPAELKIISPEAEFTSDGDAPTLGGGNDGSMGMMKAMLKEMRIAMAIEVSGEIRGTNASYHEGRRITLMELDFGKLIEDADRFEELAQANPQTIGEMQELMEGIEGIKVQLEPELWVSFGAAPPAVDQAPVAATPIPPAQAIPFTPAAPDRPYAWHDIAVAKASDYLLTLAEVTDDSGAIKGLLLRADADQLAIRRAASEGGGEMTFAIGRVRRLRVFHNR